MTDRKTLFEDMLAYIADLASFERMFGANQALMQFGSQFRARSDSSTRLPRGKAKECYANASKFALTTKDLFYVEGYGVDPNYPIPIEHAWLVDSRGYVVDPTWEKAEEHLYFGIAFKQEFLHEMLRHSGGVCGLLPNFKLMRRHYGTSELLKANMMPIRQF